MENLKLSKAIDINGEQITVLEYNFEDMTARDKAEASKEFKKAGNVISVQELDPDYHLYLFAAAAKKANDKIDINDVLRLSAKDACKAEGLARNFFFLNSED
jgi:hypothetical protein